MALIAWLARHLTVAIPLALVLGLAAAPLAAEVGHDDRFTTAHDEHQEH